MKRATFRKMRLVPFDEEDGTPDERQERVRTYDPTVNVIADLVPNIIHPKSVKATTKPTKKPSGIAKRHRGDASTAAQLLRSVRVHEYKALQAQRMPVANIPEATPPTTAAPVAPPVAPAAAKVEAETVTLPADIVPTAYRAKLARVLDHVAKADGAISRTSSDELVIDGVIHRGTSFTGALRSLYVNSASPAPGTHQLVRRLSALKVPKSLLSSKYAHVTYAQQTGSGRAFALSKSKWPGKKLGRVLRVY